MRINACEPGMARRFVIIDATTGLKRKFEGDVLYADDERHILGISMPSLDSRGFTRTMIEKRFPRVVIDLVRNTILINVRDDVVQEAERRKEKFLEQMVNFDEVLEMSFGRTARP